MGRTQHLSQLFEKAYQDFHSRPHRDLDPIKLVHQYTEPRDQEVAAFLTALLAYGTVATILSSVEKVLAPLGKSPHDYIKTAGNLNSLWKGFTHRFTRGEDIEILAYWIQAALRSHGSLEAFFVHESKSVSMKDLLSSFVQRFTDQDLPSHLRKVAIQRKRNLKYLISDPNRGSACKRLNLFLRWVVRPQDGIDLGLWKKVSPAQLILPLDTHLLKTLHQLKWTRSQQASWKVAELATQKLKHYDAADPIRFDFALCHLSMSGYNLKSIAQD